MELFERFDQNKKFFSKSELKVYHYLKKNVKNIETYTITKLALEAGVSTAAIQRFCQSNGYLGYKDFKYDIMQYLLQHHEKKSVDFIDHYLDIHLRNFEQLKYMDRQILDQMIHALLSQTNNFLFGIYLSSIPVQYLNFGLQSIGIPSYFADDFNKGTHLTNLIKPQDTLVVFSIEGNTNIVNQFLSEIKNTMPKESYLITSNPKAKASKYFSHTITLPGFKLSKDSIIDIQSLAIAFVEIIVNLTNEQNTVMKS